MQTIYRDKMSDIRWPYDIIVCHNVKVSVAYFSLSSDFAMYLNDYWMDEPQTLE